MSSSSIPITNTSLSLTSSIIQQPTTATIVPTTTQKSVTILHWFAWKVELHQHYCTLIDRRIVDNLIKLHKIRPAKPAEKLEQQNEEKVYYYDNIHTLDDDIEDGYMELVSRWSEVYQQWEYFAAETDASYLAINYMPGICKPEHLIAIYYKGLKDSLIEIFKNNGNAYQEVLKKLNDKAAQVVKKRAQSASTSRNNLSSSASTSSEANIIFHHKIVITAAFCFFEYGPKSPFHSHFEWINCFKAIEASAKASGLPTPPIQFWPSITWLEKFYDKCVYMPLFTEYTLPTIILKNNEYQNFTNDKQWKQYFQEKLDQLDKLNTDNKTKIDKNKNPLCYVEEYKNVFIKANLSDRNHQVAKFSLADTNKAKKMKDFINKCTNTFNTGFLLQPECIELSQREFKLLFLRGTLNYTVVTHGSPINNSYVLDPTINNSIIQPDSVYFITLRVFAQSVLKELVTKHGLFDEHIRVRIDCGVIVQTTKETNQVTFKPFLNEITTGLDCCMFAEITHNPQFCTMQVGEGIIKHFIPHIAGEMAYPRLSQICEYCGQEFADNSGLWKHNPKCQLNPINRIENRSDSSSNTAVTTSSSNTKQTAMKGGPIVNKRKTNEIPKQSNPKKKATSKIKTRSCAASNKNRNNNDEDDEDEDDDPADPDYIPSQHD